MLTITIAGTDRTTSVDFGSLKRTDTLNQEVDTCSFTLKKYGTSTFVPTIGDEVSVVKDGTTIFGGVIVRIDEKSISPQILQYSIDCNDYSQFLKRKLVTERYNDTTVGDIIDDIVSNYTSDGFTTTNVAGSLAIESIAFNRLSVADSLQKRADAISYVWYVDYDKDIHFFPKNTEVGPALTDTSGNYIYTSLEIREDVTQIKNSVLVQGGEQDSASPRTEYLSGDGTKLQFPLINKFSEQPTVTVGGVAQTVGVEYLDDDASFQCMWNYNEKYIRFTAGNTPASGTNNIEVSAIYSFPIVVKIPSPSSQELYGTYEFAITDKSIKSQAEAIARAQAELKSYQNKLYEGSFTTYNDGFRSGQVVTINSAQRGKVIDVLVQSVSAKMRDPIGETLEYTVQFATMKTIGIIEYLQNQLRSKEIVVDDADTLLNYIQLGPDTVTATDSLATPTHTSGPYKWSNDAGTTPNKIVWGYFTWS